jgi:hypothetical protein
MSSSFLLTCIRANMGAKGHTKLFHEKMLGLRATKCNYITLDLPAQICPPLYHVPGGLALNGGSGFGNDEALPRCRRPR